MRAGWVVVGMVALAVTGCASNRAAKGGVAAAKTEAPATGGSGPAIAGGRYVDVTNGFEVSRPGPDWQLDVTADQGVDGIVIPVVLRHTSTGAQVVVQVAPAVASPVQFAEKLTEGMRNNPGFVTSDPEPLPLTDDAVGFMFSMGDKVLGRVAVLGGGGGRMLMLLGTWPVGTPVNVVSAIDEAFRSVVPVGAAQGVAPHAQPVRRAPLPNEI